MTHAAGGEVLDSLVELGVLAELVDSVMARLADEGAIGTPSPAGEARTAMVASGLALQTGDFLFGTARDLPAGVARGVSLNTVFAQILSRKGDPSLGRGLPGALNDLGVGISLSDGNVGSHLVHACGFGLSARLRRDNRVALALFGTGAQESGEIHAALNFAGVYNAQVIFVARGPLAGAVPFEEAAEAWGLRVETLRGDDGLGIHGAVRAARARAVAGEGACIIDARLTAPWKPLDQQAHQVAGRPQTADSMRQELQERVQAALGEAGRCEPISPDTMSAGLFAGGAG